MRDGRKWNRDICRRSRWITEKRGFLYNQIIVSEVMRLLRISIAFAISPRIKEDVYNESLIFIVVISNNARLRKPLQFI